MKQGGIVLGILLAGQLVGASVIYFLADMANRNAAWAREETWPWVVIAAVGIACALTFLRGAFAMIGQQGRTR